MKEVWIEKQVYYHDTDAGGVVYYANYLKFLEEARTQYCRECGIEVGSWFERGIGFVVVHAEIDYKLPARYGQTVRVSAQIEKIGDSSVHFVQSIRRLDAVLVQARVVWACIDSTFKSISLPAEVRQALTE